MTRNRMEAFSDGVIAIIITIMVLELKPPHDATLSGLIPLTPVLLSYLLSFVFLGIYWSNHHHLLQAVEQVDGRVLWANLHLLFWLSLTPFVTAWMGENLPLFQRRSMERCCCLRPSLTSSWHGRYCRFMKAIQSWRKRWAAILKGRFQS